MSERSLIHLHKLPIMSSLTLSLFVLSQEL
jgi:hypothetical protein